MKFERPGYLVFLRVYQIISEVFLHLFYPTYFDKSYGHALLWRSDGTPTGTNVFKDFGIYGWIHGEYAILDDFMYFPAKVYGEEYGTELWRTDGTNGGTKMIIDFVEGKNSSSPRNLIVAGGKLYFSALHRYNGWERRGFFSYTP